MFCVCVCVFCVCVCVFCVCVYACFVCVCVEVVVGGARLCLHASIETYQLVAKAIHVGVRLVESDCMVFFPPFIQ